MDTGHSVYEGPKNGATSANFICNGKLQTIAFTDIILVAAEGAGTTIYTEGTKYGTGYTVFEVACRLPAAMFLRVHRAYVVSLAKVDRVENYHVVVDSHRIPINYFYRQRLLGALARIDPPPVIEITKYKK